MDICCNVYTLPDLSAFLFKCTKCHHDDFDDVFKDWPEFVKHLRDCQISTMLTVFEEPYIYDESQSKLPKLEVIEPEATDDAQDRNLSNQNVLDDYMESMKREFNEEKLEINQIETEIEESDAAGDDFDEDDYHPELSSDENSSDEETTSKKSAIKFTPSFYRDNKCTKAFINSYKQQPCLWDIQHKDYGDEKAQEKARQVMINEIEKQFKIQLKVAKMEILISKFRQQYFSTQERIKKGKKSKLKDIVIKHFEDCSFLGDIEEESNKNLQEETTPTKCKKQFLIFSNLSKPATQTFIKLYAFQSLLYDPNHNDHGSNPKRKAAFNFIIDEMNKEHNILLNTEKMYKHIRSLRQWYYNITERQKKGESLTEDELKFMNQCKFLPPKKKNQKLLCQHCNNFLTSKITLQLHMFDVHSVGELPYKCKECDKTFRQRSSLRLHIQRSHLEKKLECEYCQRRFAVIADYQIHKRTHTAEKPYICELCGKAFRMRTQLGYHMTAVHTKVRAFKCTMCPKDFLKQVHLKDHIKSHLNIRDKICETCGKGFTNCHSLIRHRQIHSEIKKFECKVCDAKFHQFVGLNSHMKRRHNIVKEKPRH